MEPISNIPLSTTIELGYAFTSAKLEHITDALLIQNVKKRPVFLMNMENSGYLFFYVPLAVIDNQIVFRRVWDWKGSDKFWGNTRELNVEHYYDAI